MEQVATFLTSFAGGYTEKPNTRGMDNDSRKTSAKNSQESPMKFGYKCVCLNARSIVNKINELLIMVEDIEPHIIGITESWATAVRYIRCRIRNDRICNVWER